MLCIPSMHLDRRFLVGFACAVSLVAAKVAAQPAPPPSAPQPADSAAASAPASPDTLETPYTDAPPPPPPTTAATPLPPPPPALPPQGTFPKLLPAQAPPDKRPLLPIRAQRKLALLGEVSWNGLAGFGPVLVFNATPQVALDLGAGLSLLGWKAGVRGRYNFLTSSWTPFVGVGFDATSGLGQFTTNPADESTGDPNRPPVTIDVKPSYLVQSLVGFDYVHRRGFTMLGGIGYAWLLNHHNYDVLAGTPTSDERQGFNLAFKGGFVLEVDLGYSLQ